MCKVKAKKAHASHISKPVEDFNIELNKELALENGQRQKAGPKSYQLTREHQSGDHYKYNLPNGDKKVLHLLTCHESSSFRVEN